MNITVRLESEKDHRFVEEVTRCAFAYEERIERGQIGCPYEHWMVHELRKRDGISALSLVAVVEGNIVGHIICSKAEVRTADKIVPVLNMGPISVLPDYLAPAYGGKYYESDIYNDELNRDAVKEFDKDFLGVYNENKRKNRQ